MFILLFLSGNLIIPAGGGEAFLQGVQDLVARIALRKFRDHIWVILHQNIIRGS